MGEDERAERSLRGAPDQIEDGFVTLDRAWRITFLNRGAEMYLQRCRDELLGRVVWEVFPRLVGTETERTARAAAAGTRMVEMEMSAPVFRRHVSMRLFPSREGLAVSFCDDTERKRAVEALRLLTEAGRLLPSALDTDATLASLARLSLPELADALVVDLCDDEGVRRVVASGSARGTSQRMASPAAPRSRGAARALATGEAELVPSVTAEWLCAAGEDGAGPEAVGAHHPTSVIVVPLVARGATLGALTLLRRDPARPYDCADLALAQGLADRAALALDNARLYVQAVEARRRRDEVLGVVSHDLRNPLNTIQLNARLLRRSMPCDELDAIRAAVARADRLVQDLIAVTAVEAGRLPLSCCPEALGPLLEEVAALHRPLAGVRSVAIEVRAADALLAVPIDHHRIVQALSNLVGNAIRFAPAQSAVVLRTRQVCDGVELDVIDLGPGIPADELPRVFDRFWRGHVPTQGCIGLGLAIAKGIAEAHHGSLRVASEPGQGATFTLALPAG